MEEKEKLNKLYEEIEGIKMRLASLEKAMDIGPGIKEPPSVSRLLAPAAPPTPA